MKAQISIEFLISLSVLLVIFLIFSVVYSGQMTNLFQTQNNLELTKKGYALANAVNYVYLAGDGATYNFTTSVSNSGGENISAYDNIVEADRSGASVQVPLIIRGLVNRTINTSKGNIIIWNNQSVITLAGQ